MINEWLLELIQLSRVGWTKSINLVDLENFSLAEVAKIPNGILSTRWRFVE